MAVFRAESAAFMCEVVFGLPPNARESEGVKKSRTKVTDARRVSFFIPDYTIMLKVYYAFTVYFLIIRSKIKPKERGSAQAGGAGLVGRCWCGRKVVARGAGMFIGVKRSNRL